MFAPYCPHCESQRLLGSRRIVGADRSEGVLRVVLRCYCDTLLEWRSDESGTATDRILAGAA